MWPDPNRKLSNRTLPAVLSWGVLSWGGQDLNLRPTDYEFDPPLSPTSEIEPERAVDKRFSPQSSRTFRNVSQSVAGPMRDTSRAELAERRESELLCIRTSVEFRPTPPDSILIVEGSSVGLPKTTWSVR
jgi:hypothetical protein